MPPKRSVQSESIVTPPVVVDPLNMIALLSGDDELFLVDRNCALVSQRCRRYIQEVERHVAAAAAATPGGGDGSFEATFGNSSQGGNSSACTSPKARGSLQSPPAGNGTSADGEADEDAWRNARITFCDYESRSSTLESARSPSRQCNPALQQLSVTDLLEACRRVAASRHESVSQQTDPQRPLTGRKSTSSVHRHPMNPFIAVTGANGHRLYPVIDLPDVPSALLTLGVTFMYHKFQADNDGEKRPAIASGLFTADDTAGLIAVSTLMEM